MAITAAAVIVGAAAIVVWAGQTEVAPNGPIEISVTPIAFDEEGGQRIFGRLLFLGGIEISSPANHFGGLSGLAVSEDGAHMLAVSDAGYWFTARLLYDGIFLSGMSDAAMGALLGPDGAPVAGQGGKSSADAESIALLSSNEVFGGVVVSFEREHRMLRYDFTEGGFDSRPTLLTVPDALFDGNANGGLEAIEIWDDGRSGRRLLLIPESGPQSDAEYEPSVTGWIADGAAFEPFRVRLSEGFLVTGAATLSNLDGTPGDLLILERRYTLIAGPAMRIRRIARETVHPGAVLDGDVLIEADMSFAVDNMEGLAVRPGGPGEAVLYVISDDNYSVRQRTLLLQFAIIP